MELIGDGTTLLESYPVKKKFRGRNNRQHFPKIIFIFKMKFTKQKCTKCSYVIPVARFHPYCLYFSMYNYFAQNILLILSYRVAGDKTKHC